MVFGFQVQFYKVVKGIKKTITTVNFLAHPATIVKEDVKKNDNSANKRSASIPNEEENSLNKALSLFSRFLSFKSSDSFKNNKNGNASDDDDKEDAEENPGENSCGDEQKESEEEKLSPEEKKGLKDIGNCEKISTPLRRNHVNIADVDDSREEPKRVPESTNNLVDFFSSTLGNFLNNLN